MSECQPTKHPMMQPCRRGCGELVHLENDGFHVCREQPTSKPSSDGGNANTPSGAASASSRGKAGASDAVCLSREPVTRTTEQQLIDTGDTVRHGPTGETWTVAYVDGDRLAWCGWPPGEASLANCTLVEKATPEYRDQLLQQLADMRLEPDSFDRRKRVAELRLKGHRNV